MSVVLKRGLPLLAALAIWQAASLIYPPLVLPSPRRVFFAFWDIFSSGSFLFDAGKTAARLLCGLTISLLGGLVLGLLMGLNKAADFFLSPLLYTIQAMPPVLYLVLAMIWFGLGGASTVFILALSGTPIIAVCVKDAMRAVDSKLVDMGRTFRFRRSRMIREIYAPSIRPYLKSSIVVLVGLGWKMVIMGEFMTSANGFGSRITDARMNLQTDRVFAWGLLVLSLSVASQKAAAYSRERKRP